MKGIVGQFMVCTPCAAIFTTTGKCIEHPYCTCIYLPVVIRKDPQV